MAIAASCAMASVPSVDNSNFGSAAGANVNNVANLTALFGGTPDPTFAVFQIQVRDLNNQPIPNSSVVIDWEDCFPDIKVCEVSNVCVASSAVTGIACGAGNTCSNPDPVVTCTATEKLVSFVTGDDGCAAIVLVGGAGAPAQGVTPSGCGTIYADGVNLGSVNIGVYDLDSGSGVNPADMSQWLQDSLVRPGEEARADYDGSGTVNPADFALLLSVSLHQSGTGVSCSNYCN
jgi:hypothetical protein